MTLTSAYQVSASVIFSMMTSLWLCSLVLKDASIVDRFWGFGFALIAIVLSLLAPEMTPVKSILTILVCVWGLRLSLYIHLRNKGHSEDFRYAAMRAEHGRKFWWYSFLSVFCLQGALMLIVSAPVIFVLSAAESTSLTSFSVIATVIWLTGFIFEAGGDFQLNRAPAHIKHGSKVT